MGKNLIVCSFLAVILGDCSPGPSPREVTFEFIYAVLDGDSTAVLHYLDLERMVEKRMQEVPPTDSALTPADLRTKILQNLTGDGLTRAHWQNQRIVVNKEIIEEDSAAVEMTFIDQTTGRIEYSMVYLYRKDNRWWVYFYL